MRTLQSTRILLLVTCLFLSLFVVAVVTVTVVVAEIAEFRKGEIYKLLSS